MNIVKSKEPKNTEALLSGSVGFEPNQLTSRPIEAMPQLTNDE